MATKPGKPIKTLNAKVKKSKVKFYIRDGAPMKEQAIVQIEKDGSEGKVIALSNPFDPDTDTPIETEAEYETLFSAYKSNVRSGIDAAREQINARRAEIEGERLTIMNKLTSGVPLSESEAKLLLMGYTPGGE
jgi:hypothetical protein